MKMYAWLASSLIQHEPWRIKMREKVQVTVDGQAHEMPLAFRAVHLLAVAGKDNTYRIFADGNPLGDQLHPDEWVTPGEATGAHGATRFVCVPHAVGPGGGDDRRVARIREAHYGEIFAEDASTPAATPRTVTREQVEKWALRPRVEARCAAGYVEEAMSPLDRIEAILANNSDDDHIELMEINARLLPLLREFAAAWADNSPRSDIRRVVARRILVDAIRGEP